MRFGRFGSLRVGDVNHKQCCNRNKCPGDVNQQDPLELEEAYQQGSQGRAGYSADRLYHVVDPCYPHQLVLRSKQGHRSLHGGDMECHPGRAHHQKKVNIEDLRFCNPEKRGKHQGAQCNEEICEYHCPLAVPAVDKHTGE